MLRFDLNISITMPDVPFLDRFDRAARLGFDAVEFWWPAGVEHAAIARRARDAGVRAALFNLDGGDLAAGERGLLNDPSRRDRLAASLHAALELAQQLGCTRLNALAGLWRGDAPRAAQLARVGETLAWLAEQARPAGITMLVESLNRWDTPDYMFTSTADTLAFLDTVPAPNVAYQYDVYHMQRMEGNIVATLQRHIGRIGHIQLADSPGRHQPGTGELRFPFILDAIAASGYDGFVGLEYVPLGALEDSLAWMPGRDRPRAEQPCAAS